MSSIARRPARGSLGLLLSALLLVGALSTDQATAATYAVKKEQGLVNEERTSRNRNSLKLQAKLTRIAQKHSRRMAKQDELFHNPNLVEQLGGMPWSRVAENVGVGPDLEALDESLETLHQAFMDSAPHRKNILMRGLRKVGVGVVESGGKVWVTIVFLG